MRKQLYQEIRKKHIDWKRVEELINGPGSSINEIVKENTILSDLYHGLHGGNTLVKLTEIFLQNGYDVNANDGLNGALCLHNLCWSTYDHYILHAAEMLLDAGANSKIQVFESELEDTEGVLDSISWKLGSWTMGDYESANMFEAYYLMVDRYQNGKKYKNIRAVRECVGRAITKIEKLILKEQEQEEDSVSNSFCGAYLLTCENIPVVVSKNMEAIINPYIKEDIIQKIDVSNQYLDVMGAKIKGIRFTSANSFRINLDNGYGIGFCNDFLMGIKKHVKGYITITKSGEPSFIPRGALVKRLYLRDGYSHGESNRTYEEKNVFLKVEDKVYRIYAEGNYKKRRLCVEDVPLEACQNLCRSVMGQPFVYEGCILSGKAIKSMRFATGDNVLYLAASEWGAVRMFMMDKKDCLKEESGEMRKIEFVVECSK